MRLMILLFISFYISQRPKEIQFPLQLNWRCGPDMPFGMYGYQSVVINGMVYVGGGWTNRENMYIVMTYDTHSGRWGTLPPYRTHGFGMTVIRDQLVLVGGGCADENGKSIGVWRSADKEWVDLYPDMPTPRWRSSVVTYNEWLIVAGGYNGECLSSVDVMNIDTKEWYSGPPAPTGFLSMKTATVGDMCYYMGGHPDGCAINRVSLPALISQVKSRNIDPQIWKKISPLNVAYSTPLSIGGCLLALGGMSQGNGVTSIQHYRPESDDWIQVGDLPSPLSDCTCAVINDGDVLVAGGHNDGRLSSSTYISSFSCNTYYVCGDLINHTYYFPFSHVWILSYSYLTSTLTH